jgi:ribonuclease R
MGRKKRQKKYLFEQVLDVLKANAGKTLNYKQIGAALEIDNEAERFLITEVLDALVKQGFAKETDRGKYTYKGAAKFLSGRIDFTSSGSAYVTVDDLKQDVFIPERKTLDALQGDLVKINVLGTMRNGKKEGEVKEVVERNKTTFTGIIQVMAKFCFVIPDYSKIHRDFFVPLEKSMNAKNGQKVSVRFTEWRKGDDNPTAEVTRIFGYPGEHKAEIHAIMAEYGLPEAFPDFVEEAAKKIDTTITAQEIAKRRDFRKITTFTIDPVDAKDFDDALSFLKLDNGNIEVGIHIADVTHYVHPGDKIEEEAIQRATSVYLVDRCIPMLPEVLSNFVCSLRPNEEKLCFSAVFELDENAKIHNQWFGRTVIFSDRRFTYEEVQKIIETEEGEFKDEILILDRLAKALRKERTGKGSIFFDKEEVKFHLDEEGNPLGVFFKTQQDAHKLIEDFMLLANRKVAELVGRTIQEENKKEKEDKTGKKKKTDKAMVYRVHDTPSDEKMNDLSTFVSRFGYELKTTSKKETVVSLNKMLNEVKGKKEAGMIELLAIRSMPKAIYTTKNIGHYGLGFEYYTHFTSPIRRYPDMLVHRLLQAHLNKQHYLDAEALETLCKHSSDMEKQAAEAERSSIKYKQVEFMKDKEGMVFQAVISGVTEWGIYAEISENKCEGMVRMRDNKDDTFYFDEDNYRYVGKRTGKVYSLGDTVWVEVKRADLIKKQLDYAFAPAPREENNQIKEKKRKK